MNIWVFEFLLSTEFLFILLGFVFIELFFVWKIPSESVVEYIKQNIALAYLSGVIYGLVGAFVLFIHFTGIVTQDVLEVVFTLETVRGVIMIGMVSSSQIVSYPIWKKGILALTPSCAGFKQNIPVWFWFFNSTFAYECILNLCYDTESDGRYYFFYKDESSAFCFSVDSESWVPEFVLSDGYPKSDHPKVGPVDCDHCSLSDKLGVTELVYVDGGGIEREVTISRNGMQGSVCLDCLEQIITSNTFEADSDVETVVLAHQI